mmetsp:Transcript_4136/g.7593  ORF Transcript_4136/g.7593 Transcript_4136/m.7593 type:complete len:416 (+) Transcript_4136:45-1292(+)
MAISARQLLGPTEHGVLQLLGGMAKVWVTGGWLRDKILDCFDVNSAAKTHLQRLRELSGQPPSDLDLVVASLTSAQFFDRCSRDDAFRSMLLRPPLLVPAKGGRPATVKLTLPEAVVDVTSLSDQRCGDEAKSERDLLADDCRHRDVSFNALYLEAGEEVLDPCGFGLSDLSSGDVRAPHEGGATASFQEDPVRLLRSLRFAARLNFRLHDDLVAALPAGEEALATLFERSPGRSLFEMKKALLLHNRPSAFLHLLNSNCEVHKLFFSSSSGTAVSSWQGAVANVRRLESLVLEGLKRKQISSRSSRFRGRMPKGLLPAMLTPDWRKLEIRENDWAELLLAALLWRCDAAAVRHVCQRLQLSETMGDNVNMLREKTRTSNIAAHTAPPGVHLLHAAVISAEAPEDFWDRWPVPAA